MSESSYRLKIKDLPEDERPRERMYKYGPQTLRNAELLAILIQTGNVEETAVQMAERLLRKYDGDLRRLSRENEKQISEGIKGLGPSKAAKIMAAFELGRRLASLPGEDKPRIGSSEDVSNLMMPAMRDLLNEALHVLCLDTKNYVTKQDRIFEGTLNASLIHPREVFRYAIREAAASIILVHNHPSGDPTPSSDDIRATKQIVEAGKYIEIPVLDHVIIGNGRFVSLKEKELI
jgi:DNA repair protein RadC